MPCETFSDRIIQGEPAAIADKKAPLAPRRRGSPTGDAPAEKVSHVLKVFEEQRHMTQQSHLMTALAESLNELNDRRIWLNLMFLKEAPKTRNIGYDIMSLLFTITGGCPKRERTEYATLP